MYDWICYWFPSAHTLLHFVMAGLMQVSPDYEKSFSLFISAGILNDFCLMCTYSILTQ